MGERKVLNKWYPPDFDPSKIPKRKRPKNEQITVRMMLPMSVRCKTCGEYLYRGKKFNAKKETVTGEEYLGIKIFRFYLKCTRCSGEFTIKTDPEKADYTCEHGVSRNFEPWRAKDSEIEEQKEKRKLEEDGDVMKVLENRTFDSKMELDILDALADIKSINARNAKVDVNSVIDLKMGEADQWERLMAHEDEKLVQATFRGEMGVDGITVKRLDDDDEDDNAPVETKPKVAPAPVELAPPPVERKRKPAFPIIQVVPKGAPQLKKAKIETPAVVKSEKAASDDDDEGGGGGLLGLNY